MSLWYFDEDHEVRVKAYDFVTHPYFDYFMFVIIVLNCIAMAMEGSYYPPGGLMDKVRYRRYHGLGTKIGSTS